MNNRYRVSQCSLIVLAALTSGSVVHAQATPAAPSITTSNAPAAHDAPDAPAEVGADPEIVVSGTQIRGVAPVGSTIISVDRKSFEQSGVTTTNDILRQVPQVASLGPGEATTGPVVSNSNLDTSKANSVNLRGIGPQATLSLLDGRRVPPGGTGAQLFDPSSIPTIALARIEVVADGASATYGSDAVAGVVNFILRRDVEGLEASARYTGAADYRSQQFGVIAGHHWDTGSVMVAGEYTHNTQLLESQRANFFSCDQTPYGFTNNCAGTAPSPGNLIFGTTVYGLPAGNGTGVTAAQLSPTRNVIQTYLGQGSIPEQKRYSLVTSARQEIGPVTLWTEGYFTRRDGFYYGGIPSFNTSVPSTNPNFVYVPGQSTTTENVQYNLLNDYGYVPQRVYQEAYQVAVGADVKLFGDFALTAYYEYNDNTEYLLRYGQINANLLKTALACTTPGICFNPYGSGGSYNAAAEASFLGYVNQNAFFHGNLVNAKVDGTIVHLPGGDLKIAVGGEFHHDALYNHSTNNVNAGALSLNTILTNANTEDSRNVTSGYAEVIVPIFSDENGMPGLRKLTLNVAGRYDHYSDFGGTTNPKVGVNYAPIDGLTFRGSYGTSFRAPTVSDINPLSTASVLASTTIAGPGRNVLIFVGGNNTLRPETATTWSAGVDFKPHVLPGLTGSFNYYNIHYRNIIDTPGNSSAVFGNPALYAPFLTLNPTQAQINAITSLPYYATVTTFGPAGATQGNIYAIVDGRRTNVGALKTDGVDFVVNYQFGSGIGSWNVGATGTYAFRYLYQLVPGAAFIERINQATYPLKFRARGQIGWADGPVDVNAFVNYTNSYSAVALVSPTQNERVASYTTIDATVGYTFQAQSGPLHGFRVAVSGINLFDRAPPLALVSTAQEYDSGAANILGRQVSINIRKKF